MIVIYRPSFTYSYEPIFLRPEETSSGLPELVEISKRKREIFERSEKEFQEYQDWPGIEPEPMDPVRVLEEEE